MEYNFSAIEQKWQRRWADRRTFKTVIDRSKPPFYVLDMFPYPSGAGLHVGHPLGYIASDIYARYKRLRGFNVLHPMGYDAYGLPAEQYAIQTGQHPERTTGHNIDRYRSQLDKIGFSFDWSREVRTSDPAYYRWTQWAFSRMFHSYYNLDARQARPIAELEAVFAAEGNGSVRAACSATPVFTAAEWAAKSGREQQELLMNYRLAYLGDTMVNWCASLGTVLANDEVVNGVSVRGGYPVEQRLMRQWCLRVSAYAERLLQGLDAVDWTESLKETQRNWIGKSEGAELRLALLPASSGARAPQGDVLVFTTRPDTIFGVTFVALAPESGYVAQVVTPDRQAAVDAYVAAAKQRTERERIADRQVTGVFTGAYAAHPLTGAALPIWISDYVLAGYGTGAIMAVPAHDSRDYAFAKQFGLPVVPLIEGCDVSEESFDAKEGIMKNSGFLDGLTVNDAIAKAAAWIADNGLGRIRVHYRLRDAAFSRQRYWGEPFPVYYDADGTPQTLPDDALPLELPDVDKFLPTETGEPPLGRAARWAWDSIGQTVVETARIDHKTIFPLELNTMPGFAGSSAYYLRYMDPNNPAALVGKEASDYWRAVDLYIGGTEHATGHLIYARFWNKFLYDLGLACEDEPFRKLVNQGMIQGRSNFVYRIRHTNTFVSFNLKDAYDVTPLHVDINMVDNDVLDRDAFRAWRPEFANAEWILEDGKYLCGWAVEKMSKSMYNVVNPDDIVARYGADTLRMYEMFLGPLELSKPWDTNGIDGVHRFLKKYWRLFFTGDAFTVSDDEASPPELKILHRLIKKVQTDVEHFSFNTSVSAFMIAVNELTERKCRKRAVLEPLTIVLSPFAPHICEELWALFGHPESITHASFPDYDERYIVEERVEYPVSFNGKMRFKKELPAGLSAGDIEAAVLSDPQAAKYLDGKTPKKVIVVPGKIVNIVV